MHRLELGLLINARAQVVIVDASNEVVNGALVLCAEAQLLAERQEGVTVVRDMVAIPIH
jgi:hypothetical protein